MIAIIDYGMGNLRSVQKAFEQVGAGASITQSAAAIEAAERVVLPGVGAMPPAMEKLRSLGLVETIRDVVSRGKPFLGICLGLQLLFERSDEGRQTSADSTSGAVEGLGILKGGVRRFASLKVPQMGWNQLKLTRPGCPLFQGVEPSANVYFCHSYFVVPEEKTVTASVTGYGIEFTSSVWRGNLFGVQFHPEKSQKVGLRILRNFSEWTA